MNINSQIKKLNEHERYFFDIPVFRCDKGKWSKEQEDKKNKLAQNIVGINKKVTQKELSWSESWLRSDWSAYYYSEMIGMIRLFTMNMQIRGELWFVKGKISKNLVRKKWHLANPKVFEYWVHPGYKNLDIYKWINEKLKKENKEWLLKNRYIGIEAFENSGKYINYMELTDFTK